MVIFTVLDDKVTDFDRLAEQTAEQVRIGEPDTFVYVIHTVPGAPLQRIFYEIYRNRAAFDVHEDRSYTQRFASERRSYVLATNVIELRLKYAKVAPLPQQAAVPRGSGSPGPPAQPPRRTGGSGPVPAYGPAGPGAGPAGPVPGAGPGGPAPGAGPVPGPGSVPGHGPFPGSPPAPGPVHGGPYPVAPGHQAPGHQAAGHQGPGHQGPGQRGSDPRRPGPGAPGPGAAGGQGPGTRGTGGHAPGPLGPGQQPVPPPARQYDLYPPLPEPPREWHGEPGHVLQS